MKKAIPIESAPTSVVLEIHRSMIELWRRGYTLPIRWTLTSFGHPGLVVSGATGAGAGGAANDDDEGATTTVDGEDLSNGFPLPACLIATDAAGHSITGLLPWAPDRAA
jgi:hypothetical protein